MNNEEMLVALQLEDLTRDHPKLKPIHDKVLKELEKAAEEIEEEMNPKPPPAKPEHPEAPHPEPRGSIHTSSNPTMVDRRV